MNKIHAIVLSAALCPALLFAASPERKAARVELRSKMHEQGRWYLTLGVPAYSYLGAKVAGGHHYGESVYWGATAGAGYYYADHLSLSAEYAVETTESVWKDLFGLLVPMETLHRHNFSLVNNYSVGRFTFGAGPNLVCNRWFMSSSLLEGSPTTRSDCFWSLGLVADAFFNMGNFSVGAVYRPSLVRLDGGSGAGYSIGVDLRFRINPVRIR